MFLLYPTYNPYRALHKTDPIMVGEDVYALQVAMNAIGATVNLKVDGKLGLVTSQAIKDAQKMLGTTVDGVAGGVSQRLLALKIGHQVQENIPLVKGLLRGQLQHESSFLLGNYSARRPDATYDAGVAQRNTKYTQAKDGFDPLKSILALCQHVRGKYDQYNKVGHERRRWELAAGSWNAPEYTDWLADEGGVEPGPLARTLLEAYMQSVTAYLQLD